MKKPTKIYGILGVLMILVNYILTRGFVNDNTNMSKIKIIVSFIAAIIAIILFLLQFIVGLNKKDNNVDKNIFKFITIGGALLTVVILIILKVNNLAF